MHELLSKNPEGLQDSAEFVELRLSDIGPSDKLFLPAFWVLEKHALWNAARKEIVWSDPELRSFESVEVARSWYEDRRRTLSDQGFVYSDMDW